MFIFFVLLILFIVVYFFMNSPLLVHWQKVSYFPRNRGKNPITQWIHTITKKGAKKKERASEPDSDVEIISKKEIKFEDIKGITGVVPEL